MGRGGKNGFPGLITPALQEIDNHGVSEITPFKKLGSSKKCSRKMFFFPPLFLFGGLAGCNLVYTILMLFVRF